MRVVGPALVAPVEWIRPVLLQRHRLRVYPLLELRLGLEACQGGGGAMSVFKWFETDGLVS